jgi:dTDP-glucose 4,6-dehydratase/UDP-glucose 4-epimerase
MRRDQGLLRRGNTDVEGRGVTRRSFLVTGGTGFIGSALVRRLVSDGHRVRVLDNNSRGATARLADVVGMIEMIQADVRDTDAVVRAASGVDAIVHLAFVNGTSSFYSRPEVVLDVGVRGMLSVVEAGARHGTADLILASSSEVYQTPPSVPTDESVPLSIPDVSNPRYSYAGGKLISELMALHWASKYFRRVVVFRPHNVYGPDMGTEHVIPQFALRMHGLAERAPGAIQFPIEGTGNETRAFVHIEDAIDAVLSVIAHGEHMGIYHVGTEHEISIGSLARMIASCFGREMAVVPGPAKPGGTARRCPDISKLRALGYEPRVSLEAGLSQTVRWYRDYAARSRDAKRRVA